MQGRNRCCRIFGCHQRFDESVWTCLGENSCNRGVTMGERVQGRADAAPHRVFRKSRDRRRPGQPDANRATEARGALHGEPA
jgi:hypothetical protein